MERRNRRDRTLALDDGLVREIDDYARAMAQREPGIRPSRSAAARQLLRRALDAATGGPHAA